MPRAFTIVRRIYKARQQDQFLEDLQTQLKEHMKKRDEPSEKFISRESLQNIWSETRLKEFIMLFAPGFDKSSIPNIRRHYIQTLSILVSIQWKDWSRFATIFFRQGRADCDIPTYDHRTVQDPRFLGRKWADDFLDKRYIFCPIDILEGQNIVRTQVWRLPFLDGDGEISRGGFADVIRQTIAPGHFRPLSGSGNGEPSNDEVCVARKRFDTRRDFRQELENLSLLRASRFQCDRIVLSLATVTVGREFNIIFPRAEMDLEEFLAGRYRDFPDFSLLDLVEEASKLAKALAFLHGGLQPENLKCRHMDLKPPNILIFKSDRCRAGEWKIADFGISIIDKPEQHLQTASDLVQGKTYPVGDRLRYHTSTYQPPEASTNSPFGRRSDVWSLGCVLMRVLAFGIGGSEELQHLDNERARHDNLPCDRNDRFYRGFPPALNPHVEEWLNTLVDRYPNYNNEFLEKCKDLLFGMLSIEKAARPLSSDVYKELCDILHLLRDAPSQRSPGPVSDSPAMPARSQDDSSITATVGSLVKAIKEGNSDDINTFLNGKVLVEEKHDGDRPLVHAIRHFPQAVQMLRTYRRELDLETPASNGDTPLKLAVDCGNVELVKNMLRAGVNINSLSANAVTPLMAAAKNGNETMIRTLLDHEPDYRACSSSGYTALHYAAMNSNAGGDIIRPFIEKVETVDISTRKTDQTPFFVLITNFTDTPLWWEKFDILLKGRADISKPDHNNVTPLALAVEKLNVELAEELLRLGAIHGPNPLPRNPTREMRAVSRRIEAQNDPKSNGTKTRRRQSSLGKLLAG